MVAIRNDFETIQAGPSALISALCREIGLREVINNNVF